MDWKEALGALRASEMPEEPASGDNTDVFPPAEAGGGDAIVSGRVLRMFYEKKGRAGKAATIIEGFDEADDAEALDVARWLKQRIGCGGSARGGEILLQGDRRHQAADLLRQKGYKVKGEG
jgi:translation initiation factor 1